MSTRIKIYPESKLNKIDRGILGHFVEIFPGNLQGGMYDPTSPLSDADGFRTDVIEAMKEIGVSQIRWGGNFSSNYNWLDGVGPQEDRPKRYDYAWHRMCDNQFGTVEFIQLCRKVGAEPVIGINMGSGTAADAMNWVEYCNGTQDTYYANLRRSHGYEEPFNVKYWCLGNEMYGNWQFGFLSAEQYAQQAMHCAIGMLSVDPDLKLIALGLESDFEWNRKVAEVLGVEKTPVIPGDYIDFISLHYYPVNREEAFYKTSYTERLGIDLYFHEMTMMMRNAIELGTYDKENHINISWDEWAAHDSEKGMSIENAMWCTSIVNNFIRDSKYVKLANYTFFVNKNRGPLQVNDDGILKHVEHYAFKLYNDLLGDTLIREEDDAEKLDIMMCLDTKWLQKAPRLKTTKVPRQVKWLDIASTMNSETGDVTVFITNRNPDEDIEVKLDLMEVEGYKKAEINTLWDEDILAENSMEEPEKVTIKTEVIEGDESFTAVMKKHSFNAIRFVKA